MCRGTADRGVSEVVGFILVFGMLVAAFTVYQGIVVPDQNQRVEFQHNQDAQGQMQELRNAIVTTAASGTGQGVSITLGATYPTRTIATNLGVSAGSLSTHEAGVGIHVDNVRALNAETRDYVDSSANGNLGPFGTASIQYTPVYSFYSNAPVTVYENTIAYNRFGAANLTLTDQVMIDGRRITLIAINGSLSEAEQGTVSVTTEGISASSNRIAVENTTGERLNITIPTALSAEMWEEILAEEMGTGGYVYDVYGVPGEDAVTVSMDPGVTYELRMAEVGVGAFTTEEAAAYVTDVDGDGDSVAEDGTRNLVVEVRDRFNNPVSNVTVTAGPPSIGSVSSASGTTDSDGQATFVYEAPADVDGAQDVDVDVSFDGDGTENETVTFDVRVLDSDGSGGGGGGGPSNYAIDWDVAAIESEQGVESCSGNRCTYNLSVDSDTDLPLSAATAPPLTGVFVDFSTNDSTVVTQLNPTEDTTESTGEVTTTASIGTTGVVAVYASATEDSDELVLEVTQSPGGGPDLVYNNDAVADGPGDTNGVRFGVTNNAGQQMRITDITIDPADNSINELSDPSGGVGIYQSELYVTADTDGYTDIGNGANIPGNGFTIDIGSDGWSGTSYTQREPVVDADGSATFYLYRFLRGNGQPVDMSGSQIDVTIEYTVGGSPGSQSFTMSVT